MAPGVVVRLLSAALLLVTFHAGAVSAAGLVGAFGEVGAPGREFRLLRLSGGGGGRGKAKKGFYMREIKSEAEAPWEAARKKGNAHFMAGEWASAVASVTGALESNSTPPEAAVVLHSNSAAALLKLGSFDEAGVHARAGLALFSGSESLPEELRQKLTYRARDADLGVAVDQAAARTSGVSVAAHAVIDAGSPLGAALGDVNTTAYFFEAQFRELHPGSSHRFIATVGVSVCIAVFARSPDGRAFGAHINNWSVHSSLYMHERRGQGGMILENMSRAMQRVFRDVDPRKVTIRLVGGWEKNFNTDGSSFSDVVQMWATEVLPGAAIDISLMNRFAGAEKAEDYDRCCSEGQVFQVVALDSHTGKVVTHSNNQVPMLVNSQVPMLVKLNSIKHGQEMDLRWSNEVNPGMSQGKEITPIMTEYKD